MNVKKLTRNALLSSFFLFVLAIRPGFGKLNLERHNTIINGEMNRLTEKILIFKTNNYGFELHCAESVPKQAEIYAENSNGFVSLEFVE
jgi:hypothetical protein